jgi:2-methylisocitrate lyase-like PEP mutase family enzyme
MISDADRLRRAEAFRRLHDGPTFVLPNPWDAGSARVLTGLGFPALATTSGGLAFGLGRRDGANLVSRQETLDNVRAVVAATPLPVAADLENGFGATPDEVARTIDLTAGAGAVGGSIEDATGEADRPIFDLAEAVDRVTAAVEAARALPFPFTLVARAENFLYGRPDLDDTIRRLQAYQAAGADVLYAPGLPDAAAVRAVCAAVDRPVNALAGGSTALTVATLAECGVRRVSLGSALARVALSAMVEAATEVRDHGTFAATSRAMSYPRVNALWPEVDR